MTERTKATLRDLRTCELMEQFHRERAEAMSKSREHIRQVLASGAPAEEVVQQLQLVFHEADTALRVALRMHELRMQELQTVTKFPDES